MSTNDESRRYLRGDWMGMLYSFSGGPSEWTLGIRADNTYSSIQKHDATDPLYESGNWSFNEEDEILTLVPDGEDHRSQQWRVLDITSCERSNSMLVLRAVMLASRNLPYLLYRVHHDPFGWKQGEQ